MIVTIISLSLLLLAIGGTVAINLLDRYHRRWSSPVWLNVFVFVLLVVAIFASVFSLLAIISNKVSETAEYEAMLYEHQMLEARLRQVNDAPYAVGNEYLYNDIVKFNNNLRDIKRWANNQWTSWFYNSMISDNINFIEVPILNISGGN